MSRDEGVQPVVRIHAIERASRANGPGARLVVWFQGCTLGCAGCFNPATHPLGGRELTIADVMAELGPAVEGVSLSGGEPMQQPAAALALARAVRAAGKTVLMFSGYSRTEIEALPLGPDILATLDVLIDGRYRATERLGEGLRGSANQVVHLLSNAYTAADIAATPVAEIRIDPKGELILTGVDPLKPRALR